MFVQIFAQLWICEYLNSSNNILIFLHNFRKLLGNFLIWNTTSSHDLRRWRAYLSKHLFSVQATVFTVHHWIGPTRANPWLIIQKMFHGIPLTVMVSACFPSHKVLSFVLKSTTSSQNFMLSRRPGRMGRDAMASVWFSMRRYGIEISAVQCILSNPCSSLNYRVARMAQDWDE